jgi:hypothetical protein
VLADHSEQILHRSSEWLLQSGQAAYYPLKILCTLLHNQFRSELSGLRGKQ